MENEIKLSDNTIMYAWLVDRIAMGYSNEVIKQLYPSQFDGQSITDNEIDNFRTANDSDIEIRHNELKELIYKTGMFYRAQKIVDKLNEKMEEDGELSAKEYASLADTLRKYLEFFSSYGKQKVEQKQAITNNYLIFESLEHDGLIKIENKERLKYIIDGTFEVVDNGD